MNLGDFWVKKALKSDNFGYLLFLRATASSWYSCLARKPEFLIEGELVENPIELGAARRLGAGLLMTATGLALTVVSLLQLIALLILLPCVPFVALAARIHYAIRAWRSYREVMAEIEDAELASARAREGRRP